MLSSFLYNLTSDTSWLTDLILALKAPEGVFVNVVPSETTRIEIVLRRSIVRVLPLNLPSALALEIAELSYKTRIARIGNMITSSLHSSDLEVWLVDCATHDKEGEVPLKVSRQGSFQE